MSEDLSVEQQEQEEQEEQKEQITGMSEAELREISLQKYKEELEKYQARVEEATASGEDTSKFSGPKLVDNSDQKNYKGLTQVWFPLILDYADPPQKPWTIEEIINAMMPVIKNFAREFAGMKAGYQRDDAISDGMSAILNALKNDRGMAPFGLYAAKEARLSIKRGAKGASIIQMPHRKRALTDRTASLDKASDLDPALTLGGAIPSGSGRAARAKCPACDGEKVIEDPVTGEKIPCDLCKGEGSITVSDPRVTLTPGEEAAEREKTSKLRSSISNIISAADLSERQIEIFLLNSGLEGIYDPNLVNTEESRMPTTIGRVLGYADAVHYLPPPELASQGRVPTGIWIEAVKQGKEAEFQKIWDEAFGPLDHKPFNPDLPTSLQIATLAGKKVTGRAADRLDSLLSALQQIAEIVPKAKSKQFATNQLKNVMRKIEKLREDGGIPPIEDVLESVNIVLQHCFNILLEHVGSGDATIQDIEALSWFT